MFEVTHMSFALAGAKMLTPREGLTSVHFVGQGRAREMTELASSGALQAWLYGDTGHMPSVDRPCSYQLMVTCMRMEDALALGHDVSCTAHAHAQCA